jgi:hypothetical protein
MPKRLQESFGTAICDRLVAGEQVSAPLSGIWGFTSDPASVECANPSSMPA